jgi:glycerophosphoryl diester phosphodiesterase
MTAALAPPTTAAHASPHGATTAPGTDTPLVIGHRGAPGYRPEHTLPGYRLAIRMGADYIEPDLVSTRDGVLVARHENDISGTTDVADHPEFADRRTTKTIDGREVTGWFTEDFTLEELRTLRAVERLPGVRPDNTRYDGRFLVPTFDQVLHLARVEGRRRGRPVGVYPETKHPSYFDSVGLSLEEPLARALRRHGLDRPNAPVFIQSFETRNLRDLDALVKVPLVQLASASGGPADRAGEATTYDEMLTPDGLREIATYADGIGVDKDRVLPRESTGSTGAPSDLVDDAHAQDLLVHVWTIRDENRFMATNYGRGSDPNAKGDARAEITAFLDAGVDGDSAEYPDTAVAARDTWLVSRASVAG